MVQHTLSLSWISPPEPKKEEERREEERKEEGRKEKGKGIYLSSFFLPGQD
jgi:hypothetical protein